VTEAKLVSQEAGILDSEIMLDWIPEAIVHRLGVYVQIIDRWVSRFNCEIDLVDGAFVVCNLESCLNR